MAADKLTLWSGGEYVPEGRAEQSKDLLSLAPGPPSTEEDNTRSAPSSFLRRSSSRPPVQEQPTNKAYPFSEEGVPNP